MGKGQPYAGPATSDTPSVLSFSETLSHEQGVRPHEVKAQTLHYQERVGRNEKGHLGDWTLNVRLPHLTISAFHVLILDIR